MPEGRPREIVVETERLLLRRFDVEDAPFILRLVNEPGFLRFVGDRGVRSLEDARRYLERGPLESYRRHGFGLYMAELKTEHAPIGMCGLMRKPWLDFPDLAYALVGEAERKGYGSEAARAVLDYGRTALSLGRVVAVVTPDNAASIRVLEKLGFRPERTVSDPANGAELRLYARGRRRA